MAETNRHEAMCQFMRQCPEIANKDMFFNFSECQIGDVVIATSSTEHAVERYINGDCYKWYDFAIIQYLVANTDPNATENTSAMYDFDEIIKWIDGQDKAENYPDFGTDCDIISIESLQSTPEVAGANQTSAKYMVLCRVEFIERS